MVNLIELRRELHALPELAYKETATAKRLEQLLSGAGYKVTAGLATTGLIADLGSGPRIAIRADMDALPLNEFNQVTYCSKTAGVMHACGHDVHMACVIGSALQLAESGINDGVRVVMQPAEELSDEGERGSQKMVEQGAMQDVSAILGMHVDATMPSGRVGIIVQPAQGLVFSFEIANHSDCSLDFVRTGGRLIDSIYEISEEIHGLRGHLDLTELRCTSGATNKGLVVRGNISYPGVDVAEKSMELLNQAAAKVLGENLFTITREQDEDLLARQEQVTQTLYESACAILGEENVARVTRKTWVGNFADFTKVAPGGFLLLGAALRNDRRIQHTANFDIDEAALPIGAAVMTETVKRLLDAQK
ncbi:MAG: M20/M25/M40 family metallo-hydrolase [Candidatus Melainabacteria bacterium]|nr:M20/M25/M40 family metallo-hydrolase [Candidatus Melainabacteria bacterium]